jgi:hypothetical protein
MQVHVGKTSSQLMNMVRITVKAAFGGPLSRHFVRNVAENGEIMVRKDKIIGKIVAGFLNPHLADISPNTEHIRVMIYL